MSENEFGLYKYDSSRFELLVFQEVRYDVDKAFLSCDGYFGCECGDFRVSCGYDGEEDYFNLKYDNEHILKCKNTGKFHCFCCEFPAEEREPEPDSDIYGYHDGPYPDEPDPDNPDEQLHESLIAYHDDVRQDKVEREVIRRALDHSNDVIYFIRCGDYVKIGFTGDIRRRISSVRTNNPQEVFLICLLPGSRDVEKQIHENFKHLHHRGEWFRYCDEIAKYIESVPGGGDHQTPLS